MAKKKSREDLARKEYLHAYLVTYDFSEAEKAYKRAMGNLRASAPDALEAEAIEIREKMLAGSLDKLQKLQDKEVQEAEMAYMFMMRMFIEADETTGKMPVSITSEHFKDLDAEDLNYGLNAMLKVWNLRRKSLAG